MGLTNEDEGGMEWRRKGDEMVAKVRWHGDEKATNNK